MTQKSGLSLCESVRKIAEGELKSAELVKYFLDEISRRNSKTNSFITILGREALAKASIVDEMPLGDRIRLSLCGAPLAVKDLFDIKAAPTTCGSLSRKGFIATNNSALVQRLEDAGAIILGKLNLHEFGLGATSENGAFGDVKNPWNTEFVSGGSSGGSAAAIADSLCLGSLGTDTGGSIRIPASLCGVVGMKPTAGILELDGIFPLSPSLDNAGPLAKNVEDCSLLFRALESKIPGTHLPSEYIEVSRFSIGVMENFPIPLEEEVEESFKNAVGKITGMVSTIVPTKIPFADYFKPVAGLIMACEACSVHDRLLVGDSFDKYGADVRTRILSGNLFSAVDYLQAKRFQKFLTESLIRAIKKVDILILPTTPIVAPRKGDYYVRIGEKLFDKRQMLSALTRPFSLCGLPALSMPSGFTSNGLPVGLQIVAKPFEENKVFAFAKELERKLSVQIK